MNTRASADSLNSRSVSSRSSISRLEVTVLMPAKVLTMMNTPMVPIESRRKPLRSEKMTATPTRSMFWSAGSSTSSSG